jgi:glycerophosphoryl diester phosphodiesterase
MPLVRRNDNVTDDLIARGVNVIGAEILFETEEDEVISPAYIKAMHDRGLLIWMSAIIYNEKDVISAHRTDDRSLVEGPEAGWGWMEEHGADFIQTDWLYPIKAYFEKR